jgi:hypothetical protein
MVPYTLTIASQATGKSKSTILRAIQSGKLSATRDDTTGGWLIDASELSRVYPVRCVADERPAIAPLRPRNSALRVRGATAALQARLEAAEARIADKEVQLGEARDQISDLRRRLDVADEERRRLTMVLADMRAAPPAPPPAPSAAAPVPAPSRRWWAWRR